MHEIAGYYAAVMRDGMNRLEHVMRNEWPTVLEGLPAHQIRERATRLFDEFNAHMRLLVAKHATLGNDFCPACRKLCGIEELLKPYTPSEPPKHKETGDGIDRGYDPNLVAPKHD